MKSVNQFAFSTIVVEKSMHDETLSYIFYDIIMRQVTLPCKLSAKTPNQATDDSEVTGHATVKPVWRRRWKKGNSPYALANSRKRHAPILEKKLAGKSDLAWPEVCVKELENKSLVCGRNRFLESLENPTPTPAAEPDLLDKWAVLLIFWTKQTNVIVTIVRKR